MHSNPQIAKSLDVKLGKLGNVIVNVGDVLTQDIRDHLKQTEKGVTKWVFSPVVNESKVPSRSPETLLAKGFSQVNETIEPIVYDIYNSHLDQFLIYKRSLLGLVTEYTDAEDWVEEFNRKASNLYRKDREEQWHTLQLNVDGNLDDARRTTYNLIRKGIHENQNPDEMIRGIREDVFGLQKGQKNRALTYKAERIVRTELAYTEGKVEDEILRQNEDIVGVRIRYYGGPCPSGTCLSALRQGKNFRYVGLDAVADFYKKDGPITMPPYHPNCYCAVTRYLYQEDREDMEAA